MNTMINYFWGTSQKSINCNSLCLKGGGVKGFAFLGMAKAFNEHKITFKNFIGSSAGAIFAAAMACNISIDKLESIVYSTDFKQFCDYEYGFFGEGYNLYEEMGIYKGIVLYNWITNLLKDCVMDEKITFKGVSEKFGTTLVITATNLSSKKLEYLCVDTYPDMQIRDAIRMSMSIPGLFVPVNFNNCIYVDGGCTNNFAINYFKNCIGVNLKESHTTNQINNTIDLINALVNTEIEEIDRLRFIENPTAQIINIDTSNIQSTNFDITREQIMELITNGYNSTISFIKNLK